MLLCFAYLPLLLSQPTVATTPPVAVQDDASELEGLLGRELAQAEGRATDELWSRAQELREAARLADGETLDRLLDRSMRARTPLGAKSSLLAVATRLMGADPDAALLADVLEPVLGHGDAELGIAAANLMTRSTFKKLRPKDRKERVRDRLLDLANESERTPEERLAYARGAYWLGAIKGRQVMREFLRSSDPALQAQGALALASTNGEPIEGLLRKKLETLSELPTPDGQLAQSYLKRADLMQRHRRERIERRARESQASGRKMDAKLEEFEAVLDMIRALHIEGDAPDRDDLVEAGIEGMLQWMDQHSSYLSSEAYSKFYQDLEAEYGGIGAYVNEDPETGLFSIVRPIYSGPAYEANLRSDDAIVQIDDWPTLGQPVDETIKHLKGKPGTKVKLYVWRRGMDAELIERPTEDMVVEVTRRQIEVPAGAWQLLPGKVGLVELSTFSRVAMSGLRDAVVEMSENGMRAIVLDMRRNSGGLLHQAREVADLFLPRGKVVVSQESRLVEEPDVLRTRFGPTVPDDVPVVILTSRFTASAAEIVAGALRDHGRAVLVGRRTYGKGSVQQLLPIDVVQEDEWDDQDGDFIWDPWEKITKDYDGDGEVDYSPRVKLTIARYLLPSNESIHRELDNEGNIISMGGIEPDHDVRLPGIESWRFAEQRRLMATSTLKDYVTENFAKHKELFERLAVNDGKNVTNYPGFSKLMVDLDTTLPLDDVRRLVRSEIRRRVQDERGQEFPYGDFVEDVQVQKAIQVALEQLGENVDDFTEYGAVFDLEGVETEGDDLAVLRPDSPELNRARALINAAKDGGAILGKDELDELLELLDKAQHD